MEKYGSDVEYERDIGKQTMRSIKNKERKGQAPGVSKKKLEKDGMPDDRCR